MKYTSRTHGVCIHGHRKEGYVKYTNPNNPYKFSGDPSGGWRIGFGPSSFLVAEGGGWSKDVGRELYNKLVDEWHGRKKPSRKKRK